MRYLHVITDLQFGSCGKGLFAGKLALDLAPDTLVTAWAPNAGHTFIDDAGNKMVNIALPNGIIASSVRRVLIGPGSVINPMQLDEELLRYAHHLHDVKVMIHPHAAVVNDDHREMELKYGARIGSTMKGVGEAMIEKIMRDPKGRTVARDALKDTVLEGLVCTVEEYNKAVDLAQVAIIEGAQGFSLGINSGFYPYTTSRECTTMQLLSDCAVPLPMAHHMMVYGVCRTFPIRVNNRDHWSGPHYPDQTEISWADVGVAPELTTVTKLERRVFTFSNQQIRDAIRMNGVNRVFLNFCNYVKDDKYLKSMINTINLSAPGTKVKWTGWGPKLSDIKEE